MDICKAHDACQNPFNVSPKRPFLPSRLIDVGSGRESKLRLCTRAELRLLPLGDRRTLSHCWGKTNASRLTSSNLDSLINDIPFQFLSTTFQHAVIITRRLGVQYLWIDSLCIIQDSTVDWQHESAVMGQIYWYSFLNISATAARDGTEGLFFPVQQARSSGRVSLRK
jgi:hypothetical protein